MADKEEDKLDRIKSKLEKLLKLQESAEQIGSLEEAQNAAGQIQKLLLKYNLAMGDIDTSDKDPVDSINKSDMSFEDMGRKKTSGKWIEFLVFTVAKYNLCRAIKIGDWGMTLMGLPENLEVVQRHINILLKQLPIMGRVAFKSYHGHEKKNTYQRGYLLGAVGGIRDTLIENRKQMEQIETKVTSLVLTSEKLVTQAVEKQFQNLKQTRSAKTSSSDGRGKGYKDGKAMQY
jgi:hypothetical protein